MIVVFVKHYLNEEGLQFFDDIWFPYVESRISLQDGFESIMASEDEVDHGCRNIMVKFRDEETIAQWVEDAEHQAVLNDLDKFRTRNWHFIKLEGENAQAPTDINDWNEVKLDSNS